MKGFVFNVIKDRSLLPNVLVSARSMSWLVYSLFGVINAFGSEHVAFVQTMVLCRKFGSCIPCIILVYVEYFLKGPCNSNNRRAVMHIAA